MGIKVASNYPLTRIAAADFSHNMACSDFSHAPSTPRVLLLRTRDLTKEFDEYVSEHKEIPTLSLQVIERWYGAKVTISFLREQGQDVHKTYPLLEITFCVCSDEDFEMYRAFLKSQKDMWMDKQD